MHSDIHASHPEFLEGFVKTCFDKGFTEEQTSELLKHATWKQLAESGDGDFAEGFAKQASQTKQGLGTAAKYILGGLGAGTLGSVYPALARPMPFDADESPVTGVGKGALVGTGLGLGIGGLAAGIAGARRGNLGSFFRRAKPLVSVVGPGGNKGIGYNPGSLGTVLDAFTDPHVTKGLAVGATGGTGMGLGMGLKDQSNPGFSAASSSGYVPHYVGSADKGTGGSGTSGSSSFNGPRSLKDYYAPVGPRSSSSSSAPATGPLAGVRAGQESLRRIDSRISELRNVVSSVNSGDPGSRLRAHDAQREIRTLMRERDRETKNINRQVGQMTADRARFQDAAARDYSRANRMTDAAGDWADFHLNNLDGPWYRRALGAIMGSRGQAERSITDRELYDNIATRAQEAMQR